MTLSDLPFPPWLLGALALAWGCIWGSFVNVVVHRLPRGMSIVRPGSHCPACGSPVRPIDNVPVLSWLLLRGRARCCQARISPRYVLIELLSGLFGLAVYLTAIQPLPGHTGVGHAAAVFLADFALSMTLLAAAFIDAEHMYLPDTMTIGGTLFGLLTPSLRHMGVLDAFLGASVGFFAVWLLFIVGYKALRGQAGMGLGDAKLVMLAGAWFGWPGVVFAVFAGAVQATTAALIVLGVRGKIEEPESVRKDREELEVAAAGGDDDAKQALADDPLGKPPAEGILAARMPFGPFLCLAILEWMLAGEWVTQQWGAL